MALSEDLVSQFVKVTNDDNTKHKETTVYGTTRIIDGQTYVKLDGADNDQLTPVETTVDVKEDERVTVLIKNHTATITGNASSPAARSGDLIELSGQLDDVIAKSVTTEYLEANYASIGKLQADRAEIDELIANKADVEHLHADYATIEKLEADKAEINELVAKKADVEHLHAEFAEIEQLKADVGSIDTLYAKKAEIESLNATYANIDFSNIGEAAIKKIYADTGLIKDITVGDQTITGELVGVTISGDLIKGNTIKADKLVVKGSDGLYYKLNVTEGGIAPSEQVTEEDLQNGLHGSNIIAQTITAEKISVTDLIAFGATIGGFVIDDNSLHSSVKTTVDNTTRGFYVDNDGQMNLGDAFNYIKYFKDTDGKYKLKIAAESLTFGVSGNTVEQVVQGAIDGAIDEAVGGLNTAIENAQSTANAANTAAGNAQTTANAANTAAGNAQNTANAANTAATNAQNTANAANTTANAANTTANAANTTANAANTTASNAQNTANTARQEASDAATKATNYIHADGNGLVVGNRPSDTANLKGNVRIDTDSVDIRNGETLLATFTKDEIQLGITGGTTTSTPVTTTKWYKVNGPTWYECKEASGSSSLRRLYDSTSTVINPTSTPTRKYRSSLAGGEPFRTENTKYPVFDYGSTICCAAYTETDNEVTPSTTPTLAYEAEAKTSGGNSIYSYTSGSSTIYCYKKTETTNTTTTTGGEPVAVFGKNKIELGKDNKDTSIDLCGGSGSLSAYSYEKSGSMYYEGLRVHSDSYVRVYGDTGTFISTGPPNDTANTKCVMYTHRTSPNGSGTIEMYSDYYEDGYLQNGATIYMNTTSAQSMMELYVSSIKDSKLYKQSLYVTPDEVRLTGGIGSSEKSGLIRPWNVVLGSATSTPMDASQTITLDDSISNQPTGIVLSFEDYNESTTYDGHVFFVPKQIIADNSSGYRCSFSWTNRDGETVVKILQITNTQIIGVDYNGQGLSSKGYLNCVYGV